MLRDTRVQLTAGLVMIGGLLASVVLSTRLTSLAGRAKLVYTDRAEDNDSPEVAMGIAMGAFRGLFVNMLWMRAEEMKQEGKYWEAVELSQAITRLQPRFPRVWVFHAWNLAYNISVGTQTQTERWNWVQEGVRILRDKGIPANPNDLLIHKELGWIFLHKIGGTTDDANTYYKRQLAAEWTIVLGPPPKRTGEDRDREVVVKKFADWLSLVRDAPRTEKDLIAKNPACAGVIEQLRLLNNEHETAQGRKELLGRIEQTRAVHTSSRRKVYESVAGPRTKAILQMLDNPAQAAAIEDYARFVRRRVLIEDYHMEPERMVRYTEKYGPIDWRLPAAHALYWSARGVEEAFDRVRFETKDASGKVIDKGNRIDFDFLNTDRVVAQSVQELFRHGELYFDFTAHVTGQHSLWQAMPNYHFAQSYGDILDEIRSRSDLDRSIKERVSPLSDAYQNFLIDVILFHYRCGNLSEAERWQQKLRTFTQRNIYDSDRFRRFSAPLPEFADQEMRDRATSPDTALNQVTASLLGAYTSGLLSRNAEMFTRQFNYAKAFHRYFMEQQFRQNNITGGTARMEQMDSDFELMAGMVYFQFVSGLSLEEAEAAYLNAPEGLRLFAYDMLVSQYKEQIDADAQRGGKTFAELFPMPRGMEEFRKRMDRITRQRTEKARSVIEQK